MLSAICRLPLASRAFVPAVSHAAVYCPSRRLHQTTSLHGKIVFERINEHERPHLMTIENGKKVIPTFSAEEMATRMAKLRSLMTENDMEAVLFTSYHNINYYSDFLHVAFGRPYGLAITHDSATIISGLVDWAQPWRRAIANNCGNLIYTDWQRDNYWRAVQKLLGHVRGKVGVETDHMTIVNKPKFQQAVPYAAEMLDISVPAMQLRIVKSDEEVAHLRKMAAIAEEGGMAQVKAMKEGAADYEIALHGTQAMVKSIAKTFPVGTELRDTWVYFHTGPNTDSCHSPPVGLTVKKGVVSSINAFPMVGGYYAAFERTAFLDHVPDENLRIWEINCEVTRRGIELIKPGVKCKDVAMELNELFRKHDLPDARPFGYGHSFGILCHYYGREAALEFREDIETVLEPNMVVSMEPMTVIQEGMPGAGGYREHDMVLVTEDGNEDLNTIGFGPEHFVIKH
ncbi:creatinase-like [Amphiura filiformis]|uniref:creatinase-like n=1 Tax=Amphiura filiformis TaxID=82378 RepID=UPI003B21B39D